MKLTRMLEIRRASHTEYNWVQVRYNFNDMVSASPATLQSREYLFNQNVRLLERLAMKTIILP